MSKIKQGLGRGLDALIRPQVKEESLYAPPETSFVPDDGEQHNILSKIPVEMISPNPFQPRLNFEPEAFDELKKSILANGLIQPITVRRIGYHQYQLISGERRLKACREIGYREIPAYIIKVDTDEAMLALALIENIQREKLNPIEIAAAFKRLMDECGLNHEEIAERVGKDRSTIANSIRLLKLPKEIQDNLISEEITAGHARALINLPAENLQLDLLKKIKENNLSVRKVEQLVKKLLTDNSPKKSFSISSKNFQAGTSLTSIEDRLRKIFGTKVICRQKHDGAGDITIEFYSNDELERLFELFDIIDKSYN